MNCGILEKILRQLIISNYAPKERIPEYFYIDIVQKFKLFKIKQSAFKGWGSATHSGLRHELRSSFPIARDVVSGSIR